MSIFTNFLICMYGPKLLSKEQLEKVMTYTEAMFHTGFIYNVFLF